MGFEVQELRGLGLGVVGVKVCMTPPYFLLGKWACGKDSSCRLVLCKIPRYEMHRAVSRKHAYCIRHSDTGAPVETDSAIVLEFFKRPRTFLYVRLCLTEVARGQNTMQTVLSPCPTPEMLPRVGALGAGSVTCLACPGY